MKKEIATLAGGCFWCTEAIFQRLKGVTLVVSGYSADAEAIQIKFDPQVISFDKLLEVFFKLHDPTTINQQGNDVGNQYRSVIFYHNNNQKQTAEKIKQEIEKSKIYRDPVITEVVPFKNFYKAEDYHQDYYEQNRNSNPYCRIVIDPKIQKLYQDFKDKVKESE